MSIDISANDFLMGGGVKSAEFPDRAYGTTWTGTICQQPTVQQQTDLKTGELKFWKSDNKPMMQLVVAIQTDVRDPQIPDDDGKRSLYIKAKLQAAVRDAVRASGSKGLEIGGTLSVTYTGDGVQEQKGFNPPKLYTATYAPPAQAAANGFLNGSQQQPQAPQQQYAAPQAQAAQQPAADGGAVWTPPPGMDPTQAAALAALPHAQRVALGYP